MGYHRAGFQVVGVDVHPQPNYPFDFIQMDALEWTDWNFDAVHASPPCQEYAPTKALYPENVYPDLYEPTREMLAKVKVPWVIENVIGAPYRSGFVLCGSMFGLPIRRHRNFETSGLMLAPRCRHSEQGEILGIYGHSSGANGKNKGPRQATTEEAKVAMEMPWATREEITQAIPPAYSEWIGQRLMEQIAVAA